MRYFLRVDFVTSEGTGVCRCRQLLPTMKDVICALRDFRDKSILLVRVERVS